MKDHEEFSTLSAAERRELIIAELKRKSRIRTLLRGLPLDEVREIIDRMKGVLNELEEEYKKREEEEKEKRVQAERIMSDMESCGVDINLLNEMYTSKSEPDNAKYSKDGASWSGQGRRPDAFKGLGHVELERFRIPQKK
ncbi:MULTISPECIES: H-NS family nucleoid-associated regulatory protein [Gammaproteobacteria]|jgi:DNA-binding protein H-NS|uniref:H-NS family histone-like protein n=1 Tax=Gammaproteobacteria TaxID=1236 RepID=UPI001B824AF7|nr:MULTISPECIES: H-NS family nucleoid-associated regulatory protein [Gammaproteobacteria]EGR0592440.1 DNA-binding protein [Vibrio cholerae]EKC4076455.1 H-NS histone family protein [Escherichia coli]EKO3920762.1 H-NS histone family protein [Vibrio metschnikovii]HBC3491307.1 H-NS histone family protein [Vibrio alginolyticus]MCU8018071.1 H-NS histone family protein [Shewanella sp. SM72]